MSWKILALSSAFFAGLSAVFGKAGISPEANPNVVTSLRTVVILGVSVAVVSFRSEWSSSGLDGKSVGFIALSGLATGISWLCYFQALQDGQAAQVDPIDKFSIVVSVLLAYLFLGEKLAWTGLLGVAFILTGTLLILKS